MRASRSTYRLKRFVTADDPEFAAALLLYVRNTSPEMRTDTNEISYWLEEFAKQFGNPFYTFGFFRDRELVGYAEAAYFAAEGLIALDYIVIDQAHRRNNVFYEFLDHLRRFLEETHPEYRYGVAEVCYGPGQVYATQASALVTRLLKLQGFRVIRAPYYQPRLTVEDAESEMPGDLLIYGSAPIESLRTETYLSIVRTLYYRYYLPWKSIKPKEYQQYEKYIDALYHRIEGKLKRTKTIVVNGHQAVLAPPDKEPTPKIHGTVLFAFQSLALILLAAASMLALKAAFNLSNTSFFLIYTFALLSFFATAGIVSKEARKIFAQLLSFLKFLSRRKRGDLKPSTTVVGDIELPDRDEPL